MFSESRIRLQSRSALSYYNNWGKATALSIIVLSIYSIFSSLNSIIKELLDVDIFSQSITDSLLVPSFYFQTIDHFVFNVYLYILLFFALSILFWVFCIWPLSLGIKHWVYEVSNNTSPPITSIFRYFRSKEMYSRSINFKFNLFIRYFCRLAICQLPAVIYFLVVGQILTFNSFRGNLKSTPLYLTSLIPVLFFGGVIVFLISIIRYFLASYLFIADDNCNIINCINESCIIMKHKYFSVIKLAITFIPWIFLCFFALPILFVYPYIHVSFASLAKWLILDSPRLNKQIS